MKRFFNSLDYSPDNPGSIYCSVQLELRQKDSKCQAEFTDENVKDYRKRDTTTLPAIAPATCRCSEHGAFRVNTNL